jgi:hypothetical protein
MRVAEISPFVDEGKEYIAKGDAMQASEKLYKAVEECIKVLAEKHKLPEYEKAEKDGRWRSYLLAQAAGRLADELKKKEIEDVWARAFNIHVWGFHEGKFGVEEIKRNIPCVEWLVNFVKSHEMEKESTEEFKGRRRF